MTHAWQVMSVTFSPDSQYVASGSDDNTVRVWEATAGEEIARVGHHQAVDAVAFSPDGKYVLSTAGFTTWLWTWHPEVLIERFCGIWPHNLTRAEWKQYIGDTMEYQAICPNLPVEPEVTPTSTPTL